MAEGRELLNNFSMSNKERYIKTVGLHKTEIGWRNC